MRVDKVRGSGARRSSRAHGQLLENAGIVPSIPMTGSASTSSFPSFLRNTAFERAGLGELVRFQRDPLGLLEERQREGSMEPRWMVGLSFLYLHDPEDVEWMLRQRSDVLTKDEFLRNVNRLIGNGILISEGDFWRKQRGLMAHAFTPRRIAAYVAPMAEIASRYADALSNDAVIDIHDAMNRVTMEIVAKTLFDADVADEGAQVGHAIEDVMAYFANSLELVLDVPDWFPSPTMRRYVRARTRVRDIIDRIIRERAAGEVDRGDLLGALLLARDEDGQPMDPAQLRDECVTLFLAGHETTSLVLAHTFYALASRPEVVTKLRAEIARVLGDREPTADDVKDLVYTERVLLEGLRLYPSAWGIGREAACDVTIRGRTYPKGTQLMASQWAMHRDARHFPDPLRFDPDRWTPEMRKALPRGAYFPFADGPRVCIGNHFAMLEAQIILVSLVRRLSLALEPGETLELAPSITLRPKRGVRMRVVR